MYTIACASAVRNSNKNLLLSGAFLPSRALAFSDSYKKGFVYILGGGMSISLHRVETPPVQHHPKISCSRAYSYPPGRLPFLTVIKRVLRRRLDNMYTIVCVSSPQGKVRDTLRNARCLHSSLRLLLPTNRALFRPAKILSAEASRCAALRGPLKQHHPKISCSRARFTHS